MDGTMPDATPESRDVDLITVQRIGNHSLAPLEVKSRNAGPVPPAVRRSPGRRFKTSRVKNIGILRINGNIVDVAIFVEHLLPALATVF